MRDMIAHWLTLPSIPLAILQQHGIPYGATQWVGGIRQAGDGRLLIPAWDNPPSIHNSVADPVLPGVVALNLDKPELWTIWPEGADVALLGEAALREAIWHKLPLPVFPGPLTWLRSGGAGVFPLDWPAFANELLWAGVTPVVDDVALGDIVNHHIESILNIGRPEILVRTST